MRVNHHRLLRLEHALHQREAAVARVEADPRLDLLKRLELLGERLTHVAEPHPIEKMSPAERMVWGSLACGEVGSEGFRRELMQLLEAHVEGFRQTWPG